MKPLRCGVVGFGLAGQIFHSAVISAVDGLTLAGIVQRSGAAATSAYPTVPLYRSLEQMLASGAIDIVSIATPNASHAALARTCLLAGKHVVVDKPMTVTSSEVAGLIRLARERRLILATYQNRRWDGDFLTLQHLLRSGVLGSLRRYESRFDRFRPALKGNAWRELAQPGAGVLYDLGPHLVDQALVLFGAPQAIYADVRTERAGAVVDDAFDLRLFYSGFAVWLGASCLASTPGLRYDVAGTAGTYRKYGLDPQENALRSGDMFKTVPWGNEPEDAWGTLQTQSGEGSRTERVPTAGGDYREFYRQLRDAIITAGETGAVLSPVDPTDAWRTLRILELAFESSREPAILPCTWTDTP